MRQIVFTGNIAAGKTTLMYRLGKVTKTPCWSADTEVHKAFCQPKNFQKIQQIFPGSRLQEGTFNIQQIREEIRKDPKKLKALEDILHPLVRKEREKTLHLFRRQKRKAVFLEIPLFYETQKGKQKEKNKTIFILKAPSYIRKTRFLSRKKATLATFSFLENKQMPLSQKKAKGGRLLYTGISIGLSFRSLLRAYKSIRKDHR